MKIANKIRFSIFSIVFIALFVGFYFVYDVVRRNMEETIQNKLEALVVSRADHIETYLEMLEGYIVQLSKSVVLETLLKTPTNDRRYQEAFDIAQGRIDRTKESADFVYEILLLNSEGKVVASSNKESVGVDKSGDSYFLGGKEGTYIKDAYYNEDLKEFLIGVSAPVFDSKTNRLLGVIIERVRLDDIYSIMTEQFGFGQTEESYIVNKYGYMITPSRFLKDTFLKQRVDSKIFRDARIYRGHGSVLQVGDKRPAVFKDYRGVSVLGAYEFIPRMQWSIIVEIDAREAFASLYLIRNIFGLVFLGILILVWLLGVLVSRIIAEPIHKLHLGTEIIGSGDLDYRVGTKASDEIGQLSRAFDEMTENLKLSVTSIANMNKEIEERKNAQKKLKEAKEAAEQLYRVVPSGIFTVDTERRITTWNNKAAEITGYTANEMIGKECLLFADSPCKDKCGLYSEEVIKPVTGKECTIKRKDGSVRTIIKNVDVLRDFNGRVIGGIESFEDITERKLIEQEFRKSEERYRVLFDDSREAVMILDPDKGFLTGNPATISMFGCRDQNEFISHSPASLSPERQPDGSLSSERANKMIQMALQKGSSLFEWVHKRVDSSEFYATVLLSRMKIGDKILLQATVRDITEQKLAQDSLKESREWFSTTLSSIGDAVITTDIFNKVTFINPVAEYLTGWNSEDAIGKHIDEVFVIINEETEKKADNPVLKVLSNGQIAKLANHTVLIAKDGRKYVIDDSAAPIKKPGSSDVIGVVLVFRDVTERNKKEKQLQELSVAVEQSPVCVVITDIKGNIQYVNPKFVQLTGYSFEEVIGKNPRVLKSEEHADVYYKNLWETITAGKEWRGEFHNKKKNGELYWESASISPIKNKDGVIANFLAVKEDITERKKLERLKDDFVSTISHELRTPLTAIKEGINIVSDGSAGEINNEQQEFLGIAKRNVDRLARLINEILDFQKFESGKMAYNISENDILSVVKEVSESMSVVASSKGLLLKLDLQEGLPKIKFDRDKITQVLTNLVNNAIKFTKEGQVTISVKTGNNIVQVSVRDTGPGIRGEDLAKLFQKFVQLESLSDRKTGGTGLGLAISKDIIEDHRGKIWAESESGKGSVFSFILPIEERRRAV